MEKFHESLIKAKDILEGTNTHQIFTNLLFLLQLKRLFNHVLRKLIAMMQTTKIHQQKWI